MVDFIKLTKLDAARSQLRMAIRLFFADADPVSIHTLAAAAQEVLRGLLKARDIPSPSIKDVVVDRFQDLKIRKLWFNVMNHEQNFFKHSDRDPDDFLILNPDIAPFIIYDDLLMYARVTDGRMIREGVVFGIWFLRNSPGIVQPWVLKLPDIEQPEAKTRRDFLLLLDCDNVWLPDLE